ncbi:MAG: hypothetical protein IBX50_12615 [Marinospirillum sp.]|uniref:hypothetical protein n=1 Tax=Marinospirillum sp. TaxID=2183934 RepID=UPI0019EA3D80|nr:hypothetical protein [Marinospirillum sp.]MBE0507538.1 hypothetical protein [Marinospirillum sp.]
MNQLTSISNTQASASGQPDFQFQPVLHVTTSTPLVSKERFAELVGLRPSIITGWASKGYIPTVSVGRHQLVNLALIQRQCLEQEA